MQNDFQLTVGAIRRRMRRCYGDREVVTLQDLFVFDHHMGMDEHGRTMGTLKSTGLLPKFIDKLEASGVRLDPGTFSFERFGR